MPVSAVAVTEGSGKNLHTWQRSVSSVNREEQYVQPAEPALSTFTAGFVAATTTTAAHVLQLMSGSSTYTRVKRIRAYVNDWPASASLLELIVVRLTSAGTGGTEGTPSPFDGGDTVNATAMSLPTAKGTEGTSILRLAIPMGTAASASDQERVWEPAPGCKPIIIPPGTSNGLAVKVVTGIASSGVVIYVEFTETAWL